MRLLVTRPEADAARTAQALRARGHEVLVAPLLRVESIDADFGGPFDAVLMTSANAARALASHPRARELHRAAVPDGRRAQRRGGARGRLHARRIGGRRARRSGAARDAAFARTPPALSRGRGSRGRSRGRTGGATASRSRPPWSIARSPLDELPAEIALRRALDGVLHYSRRSAATLLRLAGAAGALNTVLSLAALLSVRGGRGPAAGGGRAADRGRRIADRICVIDVVEVTVVRGMPDAAETSDGG